MNEKQNVKKSQHAVRYVFVGISITVFNFLLYTCLARFVIKDNSLLWLATLISTTISTFLAFVLHSNITWKERDPGKTGIYKFFAWNLTMAILVGPLLTLLFSSIKPIYDFAYSITSGIGLPFDYNFIQSTGTFVFTALVSMFLNFLFYDRLVFGKKK
ncbi:GtrA family protein [Candidatus Saccharibacteria bacterium]|nr:GtrA family protein [Candidatus Saccharibacteria bacterium]